LGKKLVNELEIADGVDTLSKWMAHYLAELLHGIENANTAEEKAAKQKECCEVILKIWEKREQVPHINTPIRDLQPLLDVLKTLKEKDPNFFWNQTYDFSEDAIWKEFIETVQSNSIGIYTTSFLASIGEILLVKSQDWLKEHKNLMDESTIKLLAYLDGLVKQDQEKNKELGLDKLSAKERYEAIFNKIESDLESSKNALQKLRKEVMSKLDEDASENTE
jgi:hypothetical protein